MKRGGDGRFHIKIWNWDAFRSERVQQKLSWGVRGLHRARSKTGQHSQKAACCWQMEKVPPAPMWRGTRGGAHWCAGVSLIEDDGPDTDNSAPWGWSRRRFGVVWWAKRLARHKRRQRSDTTGEAETSADPQSRSRWSPWVTGRYTSHRNSNSADAAHNRACSSLQNQECCCFYFIAISPIRPHPHPKKTHRLTMCWLWKTSTCFVLGGFFSPHLTNSVTAHTYIRDGKECEKKSFSLRWKNVILSFMQMKNKAECLTVR